MSFITVHRMWFTNDKGDDVIIHISDTTSGTGTSVFSDMQDADGNWLTMSARLATANDGEDKLNTIRSLKFSCEFLSTDTYNVDFFVDGEDNRWLVEVYVTSTSNPPIFTGYLVPEGAKDIFLDHGLYGVELTASDYLQTLSEQPLRKADGSVPRGKFTIIEYVSWCLTKTFLQLPIKVVYNLRESHHTGADDHFFKMIYEEALSFETDINEREDCLTVIKKLLLGCFITQVNSEWWIVRVDEMTNASYRVASFAYDGTYVSTSTTNYTKLIGLGETIQLINEDASIFPERQIQYAKQSFKFETWQEIICNITYQRGTFNSTITATLPSGGGYEAYNPVECWFNGKNPHGSTPTGPDVDGYMRKIIQSGYEFERILVLPQSSYRPHYWGSETVNVNRLDKFTFSVDRKLSDDHTGSGWNNDTIFKIRLRGNDGSYWAMIGNSSYGKVGSWKLGSGGFPVQSYDWVYQPNAEDESQWQNYSVEVDPCPVDGVVDVMLFQTNIYGDVSETHFANIQFEYIPIIDGVYQRVTGQYNKVSNTQNRKANKDEQIFISDAVSPNWKGVLFRNTGTAFARIGNVYDYNLGTTGGLGLTRFSKWQDFAIWNQYNRTVRKFQANLLGLDTNLSEIPSMIHKFYFTASSVITDNKIYQMLGFDMDLATCQWSATFADVYDTGDGHDYGSDWEFKYTTK
jgi:hypothetical protein